jgi:hypothetical protein
MTAYQKYIAAVSAVISENQKYFDENMKLALELPESSCFVRIGGSKFDTVKLYKLNDGKDPLIHFLKDSLALSLLLGRANIDDADFIKNNNIEIWFGPNIKVFNETSRIMWSTVTNDCSLQDIFDSVLKIKERSGTVIIEKPKSGYDIGIMGGEKTINDTLEELHFLLIEKTRRKHFPDENPKKEGTVDRDIDNEIGKIVDQVFDENKDWIRDAQSQVIEHGYAVTTIKNNRPEDGAYIKRDDLLNKSTDKALERIKAERELFVQDMIRLRYSASKIKNNTPIQALLHADSGVSTKKPKHHNGKYNDAAKNRKRNKAARKQRKNK